MLCLYTVGNVVEVSSNKEEIKSRMEIEIGRIKIRVNTGGERTGYSVDTKEEET